MSADKDWNEAQAWEANWWGNCLNTFREEEKQMIYARLMGLNKYATNYYGQRGWDFGSASVLDVGCGPVSILLKSKAKRKVGVDPCPYPNWVKHRYEAATVEFYKVPAEDAKFGFGYTFDIGIIYNCLQHTIDPEKIIANMRKYCKVIHLFEWIDTGTSDGHLHNLTEENLNKWLGGEGKVTYLDEAGCVGLCYHGIFKGDAI